MRRARTPPVRTLALFGAASAVVHELRYLIAYGGGASHALAAHPHGYLSIALPGVITAALIALASFVLRAAGGRRAEARRRPVPLLVLWLACSVALASIYGVQETLEGAGAIAGSGWIGLALAVPAGLLVAIAVRGADAAELPGIATLRPIAIQLASFVSAGARHARRRIAVAPLGARGPPLAFFV